MRMQTMENRQSYLGRANQQRMRLIKYINGILQRKDGLTLPETRVNSRINYGFPSVKRCNIASSGTLEENINSAGFS